MELLIFNPTSAPVHDFIELIKSFYTAWNAFKKTIIC